MSENRNARFYFERGTNKAEQGDYPGAIQDFTQAIKLASNNELKANAYNNRGVAKDKLGDYPGAIQDFTQAINLTSDNELKANAYIGLGTAKQQLGDYLEAIQDYDQAIDLTFNKELKAQAYKNRGVAKDALKQYPEAIQDFNRAINLTSDNELKADAYIGLGNAKAKQGDYQEATQDFTQAIDLAPNNGLKAKAYNNRGFAKEKLGQKEEAIEDFKEAQKLDPSVFSREEAKKLQEDIKKAGEKTRVVQDFQETLKQLRGTYSTSRWGWGSLSLVAIAGTVVLMLYFLKTPLEGSYMFWRTTALTVFSTTVTFIIIRFFSKALYLTRDADNRLAMAKLLQKINRDSDSNEKKSWHSKAEEKILDTIIYRPEEKPSTSTNPQDNHAVEKLLREIASYLKLSRGNKQ